MFQLTIHFYRGRHAGKIVRIAAGTGELALLAVWQFVNLPEDHFLVLQGAALARLPSEPPVSLEYRWKCHIILQYTHEEDT